MSLCRLIVGLAVLLAAGACNKVHSHLHSDDANPPVAAASADVEDSNLDLAVPTSPEAAAEPASPKAPEAAAAQSAPGSPDDGGTKPSTPDPIAELMNVAKAPEGAVAKGEIPDLPPLPSLTGDREKDKVALQSALEALQAAWKKNQAQHKKLVDQGQSKSSPALKAIEERNTAFEKRANDLQDLIEKVRR